MIIGKRYFLPTFILLLALALTLTACKGKSDDTEESDDALSMLLEILESNETTAESEYYVVVIPSDATSVLAQKANSLVRQIEEITGVESVLEYDNGDNPTRESSVEIILGNTARNESKIALAELRAGDYVCKIIGSNIVIGGITDDDTIIAIDRFMSEILPYSSAEQLMDSGMKFEHIAEREGEGVLLCGFPVRDFTIACTDERALTIAKDIAGSILDKSGDELGVVGTALAGSKNIILELVSSDTYVDEAYIMYNGEDVVLRAYDTYGMRAAADKLCEIILADSPADEICLGGDWSVRAVKCPNLPFNVEMVTVDESERAFLIADAVSAIYDEMSAHKPSLLLINKITLDSWNFVRSTLPQEYSYKIVGEDELLVLLYDDSISKLSVSLDDREIINIRADRADGEPSYNIACAYFEGDVNETVESLDVLNSKDADLVFLISDTASPEPDDMPVGSLLNGYDRLYQSGEGAVYVDAFSTQSEVEFGGIACDELTDNGKPLGFLCRAVRLSAKLSGIEK